MIATKSRTRASAKEGLPDKTSGSKDSEGEGDSKNESNSLTIPRGMLGRKVPRATDPELEALIKQKAVRL